MEYVPIRVSTLRGDQQIEFDAFVKINDKFILYLRRGDSFEGERLKRLKSKKLKKMYIIPTDEAKYRTYLTKNIEMAFDKNSGKSVETRTEIIQGAQQSNTEAVIENPENEVIYTEAKDSAAKFAKFLQQEPYSFGHLLNIENSDHNIAHHGVNVSTLAVFLAKKLGINEDKSLQMLTLGCLLHDIGHHYSGLHIARPIDQFSPAELATYKTHPTEGGRKAQDKRHFDQQVISIITQHEEYIDGKGWPAGLTESKMDPLAIIAGSANVLDRMMSFEAVPRKELGKQLMLKSMGQHPLNHLQILSELANSLK